MGTVWRLGSMSHARSAPLSIHSCLLALTLGKPLVRDLTSMTTPAPLAGNLSFSSLVRRASCSLLTHEASGAYAARLARINSTVGPKARPLPSFVAQILN